MTASAERLRTMRRGAITLVAVAALYEVAARSGVFPAALLPAIPAIARTLWAMLADGSMALHVLYTLYRVLIGFALAVAVSIPLGILMARFRPVERFFLPLVNALFPIPKIALLPLLILWLGIGEGSKVATIALSVFFPTVIGTFGGVDSVPRNLIRMAQSFNVPLWRIVWQVIVPGALPGILTGCRISIAAALLVLVAAEMIGAQYGIGAFLILTGNMMQTDRLMAGVVVVSVLGLAMSMIVAAVERRLLRWR